MDWQNERYVRLYLRDTPEWVLLSWEARGLFCLLLRAVDRAGLLELGKHGTKAIAALLRIPIDVVDRALPELQADGCVQVRGDVLLIPNYLAAQEASQSDKVRQQESRAKRAAAAKRDAVTSGDAMSRNVTDCHERSHAVTSGHGASRDVTLAVPCRAVPSVPDLAGASRAAPGHAPPRPEDHVLPAPTSGREDEPASPAQQPLLVAEVAPGQVNGVEAAPGKPARKPRQKPAREPGVSKDPSAFVACRDMLVAVYEEVRGTKYGFEGAKDARAVSRLLELSGGDVAEVERRWRQALTIQAGFLRANGIAHFASNWNAYPGASPTGGFKPQHKGRATYEDKNWQNYNGEPF